MYLPYLLGKLLIISLSLSKKIGLRETVLLNYLVSSPPEIKKIHSSWRDEHKRCFFKLEEDGVFENTSLEWKQLKAVTSSLCKRGILIKRNNPPKKELWVHVDEFCLSLALGIDVTKSGGSQ